MSFPLSWEESDKAEVIVSDILDKLNPDAAVRFGMAYRECLDALCRKIPDDIANGFPPTPNEDASLAMSRPTYRAKFETSKRRSRLSSVGVWYIVFLLLDGDGDHVPETLRVVAVRHGSAPSLWNENERNGEISSSEE